MRFNAQNIAAQCSSCRLSAIWCSADIYGEGLVKYSALQFLVQYGAMQSHFVLFSAVQSSTFSLSAVQCSAEV